jgi:hypothetical protein
MATATKTKNNNVSKTLADISAAVEAIKNDGLQHFPEAASIGDAVRQGDVYIQLIDEADIAAAGGLLSKMKEPMLQLAPGNTKGSRHCLASADGVEMWEPSLTDKAVLKYVFALHKQPLPKNYQRTWISDYREERIAVEAALNLSGPIMKLSKSNTITHPEHGDWALPPGTYRVIFQRTVDEQQRIRRVLD